MFDLDGYDPFPAYGSPYRPAFEPDPDRVRHVVYVDGRLIETWTEPEFGTRWEPIARRFDRDRERPAPPPSIPTFERVLGWLDDVCGGREAVLALTADPLIEDGLDLPEVDSAQDRVRLSAIAELCDAGAAQCLGVEASFALRALLLRVWATEPEVLLEAPSATHVAGGMVWLVAKANGLLRPQGPLTVTRIRDALALGSTPSAYGKKVQRALVGYRDLGSEHSRAIDDLPALLPLGRPDLLLGSTRRQLVRARDRALEAQAESENRAA